MPKKLHTELFVRSGKRLIPTPAALRLAEHAKSLVKLTSQIKTEKARHGYIGSIRASELARVPFPLAPSRRLRRERIRGIEGFATSLVT